MNLLPSIENGQFQVRTSLANLPEDLIHAKLHEKHMSPMEQLEHLVMVYEAFLSLANGGEWDWSKEWSSGITEFEALRAKFDDQCQRANSLLRDSTDETRWKLALEYLLSHDGYHVGQICALRIAKEPDWNPYSIYRH